MICCLERKWNELNRGLDQSDLRRWSTTITPDWLEPLSYSQVIPRITLPTNFAFGDRVFSTDIRLGKIIRLRERYEMNVFAEAFNLLNIANLTGTALIFSRVRLSANLRAGPRRCSARRPESLSTRRAVQFLIHVGTAFEQAGRLPGRQNYLPRTSTALGLSKGLCRCAEETILPSTEGP